VSEPAPEKYFHKPPEFSRLTLEDRNFEELLTTKEAAILLKCSKATLFNYKKAGLLKPWQTRPRGLTRWSLGELKKISRLN